MKCVLERYMNEDQRDSVSTNSRVEKRLRDACRETKRKFSVKTARVANLHVELSGGLDFTCRLTRVRYESAIRKCVSKICDRALEMMDSKKEKKKKGVVVLIGDGATDLYLQDEIRKRFEQVEVKISDRPDECVVRGAAIQAHYLNDHQITRRIVGVRLGDDYVSKVACERLDPVNIIMRGDMKTGGSTFEMFENNRVVVRKNVAGVVRVHVLDDDVIVKVEGGDDDDDDDIIQMKWRNTCSDGIIAEWNAKDDNDDDDDVDDNDDDLVDVDDDDMMMDMD